MSSVLNQWSDFRVSKNLYKPYFEMQKQNTKTSAESAAESLKKTKESTTTAKSGAKDKLKTYANSVASAVSKAETAIKADDTTGEIDMDKAYTAAQDFVNSYNDLYSSTRQSGNATVSNKNEFISNMTNAYNRKLQNVGISAGSDGKLSIDKETFMKADSSDLEAVFGKKSSFASFMSDQSRALAAYADTSAYNSGTTYTKTGDTASASNASAVSGLLYNQLF